MKKASPHKEPVGRRLPGFFDHFFIGRGAVVGTASLTVVLRSSAWFSSPAFCFRSPSLYSSLDTPAVRVLRDRRPPYAFPADTAVPHTVLEEYAHLYRRTLPHDARLLRGVPCIGTATLSPPFPCLRTVLAVLAILLEIWLFTLYHDRLHGHILRQQPSPQAFMSRTGMTTATIPCRKAFTASSMKKGHIGYADEHGNTPHRATLRFLAFLSRTEGESNRHGRTERSSRFGWGNTTIGKKR